MLIEEVLSDEAARLSLFCLRSNLSNEDRPGLKTGMDFRGLGRVVQSRVKITRGYCEI